MRRALGLVVTATAFLVAGCDDPAETRYDPSPPAFLQRWDFPRLTVVSADVGPDGAVYLAGADSVYCFDPSGHYLGVWPALGRDPGTSWSRPWIVAGPEIALSDGRSMRMFTPTGTFLRSWKFPSGVWGEHIAMDPDGTVLVADEDRIRRFGREGVELPGVAVAALDSGEAKVLDLTVARNGDLVALVQHDAQWRGTLDRYTSDGTLVARTTLEASAHGWRVAADEEIYAMGYGVVVRRNSMLEEISRWDDNVYADDLAAAPSNRVLTFDFQGSEVHGFDPEGTAVERWYAMPPGGSVGVAAPAITASGLIYTLDPQLCQVRRLDGESVTTWGRRGSEQGEFDAPRDLDVDEQGYVYVADAANHRIQKFTGTGEWLAMWSDPDPEALSARAGEVVAISSSEVRIYSTGGSFRGSFSPGWGYQDVHVDAAGRIQLLNWFGSPGRSIEIRDRVGNLLTTVAVPNLAPNFAIDDRRWIYLLESAYQDGSPHTRVRVLAPTGTTLGQWDLTAERPAFLDVDPLGRIVIASYSGSIFLHAPFGTQVPAGANPLAP